MPEDIDTPPVITVESLRRRYGSARAGFDAVRGVDLSVRRGELFALLGTNGAGKTSTMEVLEGLALPTAGTVRVLGRDPYRERRQVRPRIGIMVQDGAFPGDLTVEETTRMWTGTLTRPRAIEDLLDRVDLRHRAKVIVKQLSGGEKRRLDLALAVAGAPEVLFLDEPTTGLDPQSRAATWQLVRDLLATGTTVLLTTHYLEEAQNLADRLAFLHRGRVVRAGTPAEVTAAHPARLSFTVPDGAPSPVPDLPGAIGTEVRRTPGGLRFAVRSRDLQRSLAVLLTWATHHDVVLVDLDARSASLEDAFLAVAESNAEPDPASDEAADAGAGVAA